MRNLSLLDVSIKDLKFDDSKNLISYGRSEKSSTGEVYSCSSNLVVANFNSEDGIAWSKSLEDVVSPGNYPIDVSLLTLTNTVCVGLTNGEIVTVCDFGNTCDVVGICDNGLLALEWSPDQELLVLVTKDFKSILMSFTFDPIHEVNLLSEEFGEKQFITVGWGKKETQFHGSEGKSARVKSEVPGEIADPNATNDDRVKISWRGDGQLYAVGFILDGIRRFKVFDREGHLQFTSEKQPGLEANFAWRPCGNVIATTQRLPQTYEVAFFEKNGLKHGGFAIPVNSSSTVVDLLWSTDSEVLALHCHDAANDTTQILIFTTRNYHWYLKQTLDFGSRTILKILWDNDFEVSNNKKLHVFLSCGKHLSYNWVWAIDHSEGKTDSDDAIVAVIDGKRLVLTGFRQVVVPPPMAAFEIEVDSQINSVHFANGTNNENTNNFFISTSDSKLIFFKQTCKHPLSYKQTEVIQLEKQNFPLQVFNWRWMNEGTLVCVTVEDSVNNIVEYQINGSNLDLTATTLLPASAARVQTHPTNPMKLFLQLHNGEILEYGVGGEILPSDVVFPSTCPKFNAISVDRVLYQLGLSHKGNFYIDDTLVMTNVSSFFVHSHFLLLTTLSHVLLCTELSELGLNSIKTHTKTESPHVYKRNVERGSKLVIAVANDTRTVLQMPRGNLEAIQPRPLSLKIIGDYLDTLKYHEAFDLMRKQRINLNLIHDHDSKKFLESIDEFIQKIYNNSWLCLFLTELDDIDVTKTMYASNYASRTPVPFNAEEKTIVVCNRMRYILTRREDSASRILPLLTTYIRHNRPSDLESALEHVKLLREQEAKGEKIPITAEEALKHLLYMVDVNTLFDVALGMYDFDLTIFVATKSQKDPKEYIPMLKEFNTMEGNYQKFSINKYLKRFDRAVHFLAKCGPEKNEELRTFVKYHSMYIEALKMFSPGDKMHEEISDDFGQYLKLQKQYMEAGLVFRSAKIYEKAVECFVSALEWELALEISCDWPEDKLQKLCMDLVAQLKEAKRHDDALTILQLYGNNVENATAYAIESGRYRTALRICAQHKKGTQSQAILAPLLEDCSNLDRQVEENRTKFVGYKERLKCVRETKRNAPEVHDYANKDCDLYSDAGSTLASSHSRSSSKTFRSSKNRRKHERKIASLKEGSQYENVALVIALYNLITSTFDLRLPVKEVTHSLCCFGKEREAYTLQQNLERLLKDMKDSMKEIWTFDLMLEATNASIAALEVAEEGGSALQGIAALEHHMRIAPVIQEVQWKLGHL